MPAIVTNTHRVIASDFFERSIIDIPTYVFIGQTSAWPAEPTPPAIKDSSLDRYAAFNEIVGAKIITEQDVISVLRRIDWASATVYDEYDDTVDLINEQNPLTLDFYDFYVLTDEFNVYKCISNNNRAASTTKPSGTSVASFQTPDGYIWKYMYTVKTIEAFDFMTTNWMPCSTLFINDASSQWTTQQAAIDGSIEHVVVTDSGTGYLSSNPPTITISGTGTGATATAVIDDVLGELTNIIITAKGSGYTSATVTIVNSINGVGATARAVLSPVGGHGKDARAELGATYKMVRAEFDSNEGGEISTAVSFRRAALVSQPLHATVTGTILYVASTAKFFVGSTVTGVTSSATGIVSSINPVTNQVFLKTVVGSFLPTENVTTSALVVPLVSVSNAVSIALTDTVANSTKIKQNSGDLLYFSTREQMTRGVGQKENIRLVVAF